jgi:hypothetical protein
MDINVAQQVLDELFPSLEALETQSAAVLEFLKDKGMATDAQLAPYLERAGNTSSVRWRALRVRTMSLLSSAMKTTEEPSAKTEHSAGKDTKNPPEKIEDQPEKPAQGSEKSERGEEKSEKKKDQREEPESQKQARPSVTKENASAAQVESDKHTTQTGSEKKGAA